MPDLEPAQGESAKSGDATSGAKPNKSEKKSRKAAFVTFVDYGSVDSIPSKQLLPLDQVRVIKLYSYLSSRCFETSTK